MPQKNSVSLWIQAVRAPFFTASIIPVIFAAALARWRGDPVSWSMFPPLLASAVLLHAGTNLTNDYYDFEKGVDRKDTFGSSRVLVDGLMPPRAILLAAYLCFALGLAAGLTLVAKRGITLLIIGLAGLIGGYLYTGKPLSLKYHGLGDALVFALMGPLLIVGSYLALTGRIPGNVIWASLPIGFLVTAILHANNLRDIQNDKKAGITTMAQRLGFNGAKSEYYFLLICAYISVAVMTAVRILPLAALAVFLSLPPAVRAIQTVWGVKENDLKPIASIDVQTAQLHLAFGFFYTAALFSAPFCK